AVSAEEVRVGAAPRGQRLRELAIQFAEIRLFVADRDDDGEVRTHRGVGRQGMISAPDAGVKAAWRRRKRFQSRYAAPSTTMAPAIASAAVRLFSSRNVIARWPYHTVNSPMPKYRMPRPTAIAAANGPTLMRDAPARSTKILTGAGGGKIDATSSVRTP